MNILITGAKGFIGKNLIARLKEYGDKYTIYSYDIDSTREELCEYVKNCDFVFNFAAVHRPKEVNEFKEVNHLFFDELLKMLEINNNKCPVLYTSSIQATNGSPYGESKLSAENDLKEYSKKNSTKAIIYRLTNTYGKWATPNHHSVVATFCYNIARDLPIVVNDPNYMMHFYYIDDVIDSFISQLEGNPIPCDDGIFRLPDEKIHHITLGQLETILRKFKTLLDIGIEPKLENPTEETLYQTYKSYI